MYIYNVNTHGTLNFSHPSIFSDSYRCIQLQGAAPVLRSLRPRHWLPWMPPLRDCRPTAPAPAMVNHRIG